MTWLYIPSPYVPESECSTKDSAPHVSFLASGSAPCVTSKGRPVQPQRLLGAWKKNAWMKRLSGLTLPPSTAERGIAAWIASLPVSPVSRTPSQAHAKASMTSVGSGSTSTGSSATFLLGSFFSKTSGDCFPVEGSRKSSDRWSASGSVLNGEYWQRPKLGQAISANASSFWPTATVCGNYNRKGASINSGDGLATAAAKWPTPMASDDGLKVTENSNQSGLIGASLKFSRPDLILPTGNGDSRHRLGSRPRLNPAFVCWLMGWPWWWMNPGRISFAEQEMVLFRSRLQQHLSCLLGEQGLLEEAA